LPGDLHLSRKQVMVGDRLSGRPCTNADAEDRGPSPRRAVTLAVVVCRWSGQRRVADDRRGCGTRAVEECCQRRLYDVVTAPSLGIAWGALVFDIVDGHCRSRL